MPEHTPAPTPARSIYGFFMFLFSKTILGIYCVWAFVPDEYLHYFNIYYYPQKYWATAVPIQCLVALTIFVFFIMPSMNWLLTTRIDSVNTFSDQITQYSVIVNNNDCKTSETCICTDENKCMKHSYIATVNDFNENTVPQLHDLNIRFVCQKMYLNGHK